MTKTQDYTKMFQDMMSNFPLDMSVAQDAFKNQAAMGEKMTKVALQAADKSAEISTKWTKETLAKMGDVAAAKEDAADYTKAMTDFASAQAELAAENMAAFAEVAKKVQAETVELMMAAGQELGEEAQAAVKKASDEVSKAAKKATAK
ncbi:Phasin [Aliiroseovarius sp. F20344]|uniref:Phasin n=1 Tax=Aliiroseovarius sp. F20344 TaxID=2926414 RepID=UPI001FF257F6|nr:Phasin [Aliiroseovarius sp. F20344]MCK0143276.1 Phasin [Aliiroseovarius sp. F20344]